MSYPKFCVPRRLDAEQQAQSVTLAINANPDNFATASDGDGKHMSVEVHKKWPVGKIIRVSFLNGDSVQRLKCQREAVKWEEYANIKFVFGDFSNPEIRVAFYDGSPKFNDQGSWSYVGTDCGLVKAGEQTLNLGWLDKDSDDAEWQRVVVHEFGHALGCDHEDQQPAVDIKWNKDAVYKYFEGPPNNWSRQEIDENVLNPAPSDGISHTAFDPTSIMAYQIPADFTLDGKGITGGTQLSEHDKEFIAQMYPFREMIAKLVLEAPQSKQSISPTRSYTKLSIDISEAGTYRVWTSLVSATVTVSDAQGGVVAAGQQQITFAGVRGTYTVLVRPSDSSTPIVYRIRASKIG